MLLRRLMRTGMLTLTPFSTAFAADALGSGDTAWLIVSTALVMIWIVPCTVKGPLRLPGPAEIKIETRGK